MVKKKPIPLKKKLKYIFADRHFKTETNFIVFSLLYYINLLLAMQER